MAKLMLYVKNEETNYRKDKPNNAVFNCVQQKNGTQKNFQAMDE